MKYAFVIGSNAFVVPHNGISYADQNQEREFLRINSIYHDLPGPAGDSALDIDLDIEDKDGTHIILQANKLLDPAPYTIKTERDSVKVLSADGSLLIHVHQLDDDSAMALEHNIAAELEVNTPVVVIRINGQFIVNGLHITAENEKLFINENGYASSALAGINKLKFTSDGVVL